MNLYWYTFFRTFRGSSPVLNISDPELVWKILREDFLSFPARTYRTMSFESDYFSLGLALRKGNEWKLNHRALMSSMTPASTHKFDPERSEFRILHISNPNLKNRISAKKRLRNELRVFTYWLCVILCSVLGSLVAERIRFFPFGGDPDPVPPSDLYWW
jgi:hypothetical protein